MLTQTKQKIRISAGTAAVLGLQRIKQFCAPTTAYFMIGERCENTCMFCSQAKESAASTSFLSRITWPQFDIDSVFDKLKEAIPQNKIKRICFQVVNSINSKEQTYELINYVKEKNINIKISLSTNILDVEFLRKLIKTDADNISVPLDAATEELFMKYKNCSWDKTWFILNAISAEFPDCLSTHIILGLGETQEQAVTLLNLLHFKKINSALFAFTPLPGTPLSDKSAPDIVYYRKIQLINYLIKLNILQKFEFENGAFIWPVEIIKKLNLDIQNKEFKYKHAFETSGCPGCNRPYYNEKPGGVIYNYPRPLTDDEYINAVQLASGRNDG